MSSFGDGNVKTEIEEELRYIFDENYDDSDKGKNQFIFDVMDVLRYICGEW